MTTVYVDPSRSGAGTGVHGDPFRLFSSINWGIATEVLIRRGTTSHERLWPTAPVRIAPFDVGAEPVIDGQGVRNNGIVSQGVALTIEDILCINHTDHGINLCSTALGPLTGTRLKRLQSYDNGADGIAIRPWYQDAQIEPSSDIEIVQCVADRNGGFGIALVNYLTGAWIFQCTADQNGHAIAAWGLYAAPLNTEPAWSLVTGTVYEGTLAGLYASRTLSAVLTNGLPQVKLSEASSMEVVGPGQWKQSGSAVRINIGKPMASIRAICRVAECTSILFEQCRGTRTVNTGGGDGCGGGFDHGVENSEFRDSVFANNEGRGVISHICGSGIKLVRPLTYGNSEGGARLRSTIVPVVDAPDCRESVAVSCQDSYPIYTPRQDRFATIRRVL